MKTKLPKKDIDLEAILGGETLQEKKFMFEVDPEKAFQKLSQKQFSDPHYAFRELVANAIDSYVGLHKEFQVDIQLDSDQFSITDYGCGMDEEKIKLLRTLGMTEKSGNYDYIGNFGIGFASLFHPELGVDNIEIDTTNGEKGYRLHFERTREGLSYKRYKLPSNLDFSTQIRVIFDRPDSQRIRRISELLADKCKYLTAPVRLNGELISKKTH